jgi:hypothetical protein
VEALGLAQSRGFLLFRAASCAPASRRGRHAAATARIASAFSSASTYCRASCRLKTSSYVTRIIATPTALDGSGSAPVRRTGGPSEAHPTGATSLPATPRQMGRRAGGLGPSRAVCISPGQTFSQPRDSFGEVPSLSWSGWESRGRLRRAAGGHPPPLDVHGCRFVAVSTGRCGCPPVTGGRPANLHPVQGSLRSACGRPWTGRRTPGRSEIAGGAGEWVA